MANNKLIIYNRPKLASPILVLGFSGWMDSGEVSTGTVEFLINNLNAEKFAIINPQGFYLQSFPSPMELSAMFRPYVKIKDGLIESYRTTSNVFFADIKNDLIFFLGKEPNLNWAGFSDTILSVCKEFAVKMIYFIGSVAGLVPHTREPRFLCSVSNAELKEPLGRFGFKFVNYEGPAGIITNIMLNAERRHLGMANIIATTPAYVHGKNPKCIEATLRRAAGVLGVHVDLERMRKHSDRFEKRLSQVVQRQPELAERVLKLEENYDNEVFDTEMGDLKQWLEEKGVRLD